MTMMAYSQALADLVVGKNTDVAQRILLDAIRKAKEYDRMGSEGNVDEDYENGWSDGREDLMKEILKMLDNKIVSTTCGSSKDKDKKIAQYKRIRKEIEKIGKEN